MPWRVGAPGWFSCSPGPRPEETPNDLLGVTLLELLVATLLGTTLLAMATPAFQRLATAQQERLAVRYVVAEVMLARAQAARRGTSVGIRFGRDMRGYYFGTYVDGNGNGLRATDVRRGVDQPIGPTRRLEETFLAARFDLDPSIPPIGGTSGDEGGEAVRLGVGQTLTYSPAGTATPGTLYVRCGPTQYAIRILGSTGRLRVLRYDRTERTWSKD